MIQAGLLIAAGLLLVLLAPVNFKAGWLGSGWSVEVRSGAGPDSKAVNARLEATRTAPLPLTRSAARLEAELAVLSGNIDRQALTRLLQANPADPFNWFRLAQAHAAIAPEDHKQVADALVMSALTGRYVPELLDLRSALFLRHWTGLEPQDRLLAQDQLQLSASARHARGP